MDIHIYLYLSVVGVVDVVLCLLKKTRRVFSYHIRLSAGSN